MCARPDLFAFQVTCLVPLAYCGIVGFYAWNVSKRAHTAIPQTPQGRLFSYLPESEHLAAVCLTFQVWDFIVSIFINELAEPIMLSHHVLAAIVSWASLESQVGYRCKFMRLSMLRGFTRHTA